MGRPGQLTRKKAAIISQHKRSIVPPASSPPGAPEVGATTPDEMNGAAMEDLLAAIGLNHEGVEVACGPHYTIGASATFDAQGPTGYRSRPGARGSTVGKADESTTTTSTATCVTSGVTVGSSATDSLYGARACNYGSENSDEAATSAAPTPFLRARGLTATTATTCPTLVGEDGVLGVYGSAIEKPSKLGDRVYAEQRYSPARSIQAARSTSGSVLPRASRTACASQSVVVERGGRVAGVTAARASCTDLANTTKGADVAGSPAHLAVVHVVHGTRPSATTRGPRPAGATARCDLAGARERQRALYEYAPTLRRQHLAGVDREVVVVHIASKVRVRSDHHIAVGTVSEIGDADHGPVRPQESVDVAGHDATSAPWPAWSGSPPPRSRRLP